MNVAVRHHKKLKGKLEEMVFLVVDDDGQVRAILAEYLKSFGVNKVIEAKDGKAALKLVQNHGQRIDIIISDWEMPNIDGLTLLRAVRKDPYREDVKFLMVSSQSSRERIKISEAAKAYVDAYVVKPFRAKILREKITNLVEFGTDPSAKDFASELGHGNIQIIDDPKGENGNVVVIDDDDTPPEHYDLHRMNVDLIIKLSAAYIKVKWFEKSIKLCSDAVALFPDSADLYCQLAQSHWVKGDVEKATASLKVATKLKPYHVGAQTLLGEMAAKKAA
jgi:two-component system, chemotaxis family, chemotaxis protein CheY